MYHVYSFLLLVFVLMPTLSNSQTPFTVANQRSFAGNGSDVLGAIIPITSQKNWVIGHSNASEELDHQSTSKGELDLWIIEEENNSINWEKSIGGSQREVFSSALKDRNGDVVILSRSNSQLNGDKSEDSHGLSDFWLVKLNESGTILWDRTIGGSDMENRGKILEYSNGYILIGNSSSNASGNKTVPLIGSSDIWVITLDFDGNITGQDVIGTTEYEEFYDAELISDQEVIISMNSFGLENNSKTVPHFGGGDCWLVRYDIDNKVITHQIALGGTEAEQYSELKVVNGFVYAAIESSSGIGGTKTSPAFFQRDIWLVKMNKELQLLEQNTFGGNRNDLPIQLCFNPLVSSNLFLLGLTESNAFTGLKEVSNFGEVDAYFIELDPESLAQVADTVFGGVNADFANFGHNTSNGFEFILFSESGLTGNKTVPLKSFRDQWLINLEFEPNAIKELSVGTEFTVFPNPAKTEIQLKGINSKTSYCIYEADGRAVQKGIVNSNEKIEIGDLVPGVYFIVTSNSVQVQKLMVY